VYSLYVLAVPHGLLVQDVYKGSPAARAGIKGGTVDQIVEGESYMVGGDIITRFDGVPVNSETRFRDLIASKNPGDTGVVEIQRGKTKMSVELKLGRLPATTPPSLG
jgi:S1-C subfamily serine protease